MPRPRPRASDGRGLLAELSRVIEKQPLSSAALARLAKIERRSLDRFLLGEQSLSGQAVEALAGALGLKLTPKSKGQTACPDT